MVRNFRSCVESSTANYSYPDPSWSQQVARDPEEDHLIALKEKDATISLKGKKISKLESELQELQASSTRQLEKAKSAAAKKQSSIEADNAALRVTLVELKLSHQAVIIEHDKKLALKEEDLLKLSASSTRLLEEAKLAAAKKQSSIEADNAALRMTVDELKLSHQALSIEHDKKLASKEEDLMKLGASSMCLLEEAKLAAAKKQSSIEADNAALQVTLDELKLSHQAVIIEHDKKLASKEEDLMKLRTSSKRLLEEAKSAAAKKQSSIEADNESLRMTLDELKLSHEAISIEQDKKLASKAEDLMKLGASSTRLLEDAKSAAAKKQSSIEADNAALRITLDELTLGHQAISIGHEKQLASKQEDLMKLRASSTRLLEEAKSAAAKKQRSTEADNVALRVTLDDLKLSHQAVSIEHDKKLASKEKDLLELRANSTRLLEEAKSAAVKKQSSIEADNESLRVTVDELKLIHQAVSIEQDRKLASKEEDLLKLGASSTRILEEAKSAAAKKQSSIEADNAALRVTLDELTLSHQAVSIELHKKLASKEEDLLKLRASSTLLLEEAQSAAAEKQNSIEADYAALQVTLDEIKLSHQAATIGQDKKLASKEEDLLRLGEGTNASSDVKLSN